ncbi:PorP/SprF family type IX secretion system membrane protein [Wenyingzhuangia sp. IMCC45467]
MMKKERNYIKNIFLLITLIMVVSVYGQEEPQYTQYVNNTMAYNPAYISTQDEVTFTALGRSQWSGVQGAPQTLTFSALLPGGYSGIGSGLNIIHDKIGPTSHTHFTANLSYEIKLATNVFTSFGLSGGGSLLNVDFNRGSAVQENDPLLNNRKNEFDPLLGAGIMTYTDKWYIGLSVPNLLKNKYYSSDEGGMVDHNFQFLLIGGYVFDLSSSLKFKPAVLARFAQESPLVVDYSANFLISDVVRLGASYRSTNIVSFLAGIHLSSTLYVGYAYDYTLNELSTTDDGSHEIMLRFTLPNKLRTIQSPRFF